ncbi:hypothetical protein FKP32DRAFT_1583591 [Trametes sanguinea]|nr:hypothetical protein FKP32DRAFT_1583591 [Trametes sanguinea]
MKLPTQAIAHVEGADPERARRRRLVQHTLDTFYDVLVISRKPISALLSVFFVGFLAVAMGTFAVDVVRSSLSPVCDLPGLSQMSLCVHDAPGPSQLSSRVDFPSLANVQNTLLDDLLDQSSSGAELALNVKHAELAVRDLAAIVKASDLSVKDALVDSLGRFVVDAQLAGQHLQRLSAKALGTIDSIYAFNLYALRAIASNEPTGGYSADISLARTFQTSMDAFAAQVARVLVVATEAAVHLEHLEEALSIIHELCAREALLQDVTRDELLWSLWTLLGGNRSRLRDLKYRASTLQEVRRFRSMAVAYVAATTQALRAADAELTELRDRLSDASVAVDDIPVEVQLASLERTLIRLRAAKGMGDVSSAQVVRTGSS